MSAYTSFIHDEEKMVDFFSLTKEEFLQSYSYITEGEYYLTKVDVDKIKSDIAEYIYNEFENVEDFHDIRELGLAYTTLTDNEIPIQVTADLVKLEIKTYMGSDEPTEDNLVKVEKFDVDTLSDWLDFESLIYGWQTYIEEHMEDYR